MISESGAKLGPRLNDPASSLIDVMMDWLVLIDAISYGCAHGRLYTPHGAYEHRQHNTDCL